MNGSKRAPRCALVLGLLLFACPRATHAQSNNSADEVELARQALLTQATAAQQRGDHAEAVRIAERVGALRMTPSIQLFLATEYAALRDPRQGYFHARACVRDAETDATLRNRELILSRCRALTNELRTRVGLVVLELRGTPPTGLTLRLAGRSLGADALGVPMAVNPGELAVEATAPGFESFRASATVASGSTITTIVTLVPLRPSGATTARGPGPWPWVLVGAGAAVTIAGSVLLGVQLAAKAPCVDGQDSAGMSALVCPDVVTRDTARDAAALNVPTPLLLSLGLASTAGGIVWWALARRPTESAQEAGISPRFYPGGVGISGRF